MKRLRLLILITFSLALAIPLLFARGHSGNSGGSSGGGKSSGGSKGGTYVPDDPNSEWVKTTLSENWNYASPGISTCDLSGIAYPKAFGNAINTYPSTLGSPTIYDNTKYYCSILIENSGIQALATNNKTFARTGKFTEIEVPRNRTYRITFDFIDICTNCMLPFNTPGGRRMRFIGNSVFSTGYPNPITEPKFHSLLSCQ